MANQSSANVVAVLKRESTYGTEEGSGAGGSQLRLLDSPGLKLARGDVASEERRADLLETASRLGGHNVNGSYETEINPGGFFDLLLESIVRGTMGSLANQASIDTTTQLRKVIPDTTPTNYGYTIEQRDVDNDESEVFRGCRNTRLDLSIAPRQMAKMTHTFQGLSRSLKGTAASPHFTSPGVTTGDPLAVDDAVITYDSGSMTTMTGLDLTIEVESATQDVIGSLVNADVYMNTLKVYGNLTCLREDHTALSDFDAETELDLLVKLSAPGSGARLMFALFMPRIKLFDIDAPFLGGDSGKVETRAFKAFPPAGQVNVIELYTSTDSPSAYV